MKILINLGTPKQVRFLSIIGRTIRDMGNEVEFVSRDYNEANLLIEALKIKTTIIGRFGGDTKIEKLKASSERISLLSDFFISFKPDLVISLGNHEFVRTAFGLGIPIALFCDFPENVAVSCLTLPMATRVFAPFCIPAKVFSKYGVEFGRLIYYKSFDPLLWLRNYPLNRNIKKDLSLDPELPLIVLRETEWQSNYIKYDVIKEVSKCLRERLPSVQIFNIPRYLHHDYIDIPSLLSVADILICGGGTMCIEAAFYGTPVIATRKLDCYYMEWLFAHKLAILCTDVFKIVKHVESSLQNRKRNKKNRLQTLVFPSQFVIDKILEMKEKQILPRNIH